MKTSFLDDLLESLGVNTHLIAMIIIATMASVVIYLNKVKKGAKFSAFAFCVNASVSVVVAFGVASLLEYWGDVNVSLERAVMVFVGISSTKILEVVEDQGIGLIEKRVKDLFSK